MVSTQQTASISTRALYKCVVPVKVRGSKSPLFLIHGGDGIIDFFHGFKDGLDQLDCPIFAIESPFLSTSKLVFPSFTDLAKLYITLIKRTQPEGPYRIGGFSFGGLMAFDIATQLSAQGESVELIMIDTLNPEISKVTTNSFSKRLVDCWQTQMTKTGLARGIEFLQRMIEIIDARLKHRKIIAHCHKLARSPETIDFNDKRYFLAHTHGQLMSSYQPQREIAKAVLIRSTEHPTKQNLPNDYGWSKWIASLEIFPISGDHQNLIKPESSEKVAKVIYDFLK